MRAVCREETSEPPFGVVASDDMLAEMDFFFFSTVLSSVWSTRRSESAGLTDTNHAATDERRGQNENHCGCED